MGVLSRERDRMLRTRPPEGYVARNTWVWADCPKHGRQAHLSYLGGRCQACQVEGLQAQGLLALERRR